jgi:CheY-like chemotaxis protein
MSCCLPTECDVFDHAAPSRRPLVLCIDDDPLVFEVIADHLDAYNVELARAFFGTQGIWMAATDSPDVIITDLCMPQGDGATVIECLKRNVRTAAIPIIVLTARNEPGLQRRMRQIGAAACLIKPIHFDDLLRELKRYIEVRAKPIEDELHVAAV